MLNELYQKIILDHYRSPRGRGRLTHPNVHSKANNPLCGDEVILDLLVEDGCIVDLRFDGRGCSISQASASMMVEAVKGKMIGEALTIKRQVVELLQGESEPPPNPIGEVCLKDLHALVGVRKFPVRIQCALLPWKALEQAIGNTDRKQIEGKVEG